MDDVIFYDDRLEDHWWRTIRLLTRLGQAGIVINPDKFQFAGRTVEFVGFRITDSSIEPLTKYLDAIREFPPPRQQTTYEVGLALSIRSVATPSSGTIQAFSSPKVSFTWNTEIDTSFKQSKEAILSAIRQGVEIFAVGRRTCLRLDFSCRGIGYFLLQQYCHCRENFGRIPHFLLPEQNVDTLQ